MIWTFTPDGEPSAPYPVFPLGDAWAFEMPDGALSLAGRSPWGQLPPFYTDLPYSVIHYTGFRGWSQNRWFDGPRFFVAQGVVQACVLPGSDAPMPQARAADAEGFAAWLMEHEVLAWKKSLAHAFRQRFAFMQPAYQLCNLQTDPRHILVLLGLRIAFPGTIFYALDYPPDLKPQWKRLCQNLNFSTWAAPRQLQGLQLLDASALSEDWPQESAATFLQQLNQRIPCVPGKLAELFSRP